MLSRSALVFFLIACSTGQSQTLTAITGQIFDAANGQPIRNASVSLKQTPSVSALTDTDGQYQLLASPGKCSVVVRADNFLDAEIENVEVKIGAATEASAVMAKRPK
jgi:hypothetical protein